METENKKMTFDSALKRIEEIASLLEGGERSLEESISLFEEGKKLSEFCEKKLKATEQKITQM